MVKFKTKSSKEIFSCGLDIGSSAVKFVKLRFAEEEAELCAFALEPAQIDLVQLFKKIKQAHSVEAVSVSVGGASTVTRFVHFPRMNQDELRQALKFEAAKHIPFPIEDTNLDGYILKDDLPDNKMLVLLAAAKKNAVSERLKLMESAGFSVPLVDIDGIALTNAFNFNYYPDDNLKNKTFALLNMGASISSLNIIENGLPILSRDIHIAGNNITQKIADILVKDFNTAEILKVNPDKQNADKLNSAAEVVLGSLAAEIRTSFDYYESQNASSVIKIFISGGSAAFKGLKDILANILGIEVECWDPFRKIKLGINLDPAQLKAQAGQLAIAAGLALRQ